MNLLRTTTAILTILLSGVVLNAQSGQIQGVVSGENGPVPFATVVLKSAADSSMVKAGYSDTIGGFKFSNIPFASYFIEATQVGMGDYTSEHFDLSQASLVLDPISMSESSVELGAVSVTAQRPMVQVLADKTVFNVQGTLNATGTNGFELLRKAPGVIIDNNDNVILEGKTGVLFYINGKPSPLAGDDLINFLRSLQASDIDALEIITQPSSKYDAAGNAGIINIKLVKDKRLGTNGTVSAGIERGHDTRYYSSISLNNRDKKTNLFGSYNNRFGKNYSYMDLDRTQQNVLYASDSEWLTDMSIHNARVGFDVFPHANHTFGVLFNGSFNESFTDGLSRTPITPSSTGITEQVLVAANESQNDNYNLNGNLNYMFEDTAGHELNVDFDYGLYNRDGTNYQPNSYQDTNGLIITESNYRMITPTEITILSGKADYSQNALKGKLGIGGKVSTVKTNNTFEFYDVNNGSEVLNADRSNVFDYTEMINAGYINYQRNWPKTSLQVGLRAEQTISEGNLTSTQSTPEDSVRRNYLDWFPSGGITYSPSWKSSWALTYSRRIQRPNYQSLNPFESQLDELSFMKGNPFLQPQYTNNVKLSHTYQYVLTTSISFSHIKDFFAQVTDTIGATKSFLTTRNIADQQVWSFGLSYPFDLAKWWSVYISINANNSSYKGSDEKFVAINQSTVTLYGQNSFLLPKGFRVELSGWFSSPSVWGGTYLTQSMGSLDIAVQKKFLNEKLTARVSYSDLLSTAFWRADMQFGDLTIDGQGGWDAQVLRFNLSYAFGNNQVKSNRRRSTGAEDEEKRVGEGSGQPGGGTP